MASGSGRESSNGVKIRAARLSAQQFEVLIQFMQQNPHFAVGRAAGGSYSKEEHDTLWRTVTTMLNETEGPIKSVTKWQKCWVDLKSNARSRSAKCRALGPHGPQPSGTVLTQWDQRVLSLLSEITSNENKFGPVLNHSPLQLLEVGFSEKMMLLGGSRARSSRSVKPKFCAAASKSNNHNQNGFHDNENGSLTMESVSSHEYSLMEEIHQEDIEELVDVKSEAEWLEEEEDVGCEDDYSLVSMDRKNGAGSDDCQEVDTQPEKFLAQEVCTSPDQVPVEDFSRHQRSKKRKQSDSSAFSNVEDPIERISKKICGTLDRIAAAAEEANAIQNGMVTVMNRLASTFEQLLPVVAKVLESHSNGTGAKR